MGVFSLGTVSDSAVGASSRDGPARRLPTRPHPGAGRAAEMRGLASPPCLCPGCPRQHWGPRRLRAGEALGWEGPGSASSCGPRRREGGSWGHGHRRPPAEGEQGGEGIARGRPDCQDRAQTQVPPSTRRPGCRDSGSRGGSAPSASLPRQDSGTGLVTRTEAAGVGQRPGTVRPEAEELVTCHVSGHSLRGPTRHQARAVRVGKGAGRAGPARATGLRVRGGVWN